MSVEIFISNITDTCQLLTLFVIDIEFLGFARTLFHKNSYQPRLSFGFIEIGLSHLVFFVLDIFLKVDAKIF